MAFRARLQGLPGMGGTALVAAVLLALSAASHAQRRAGLEAAIATRAAAIAPLREAALQARARQKSCRAVAVAARGLRPSLVADRERLGRHVVATLLPGGAWIAGIAPAASAELPAAPALRVRWRGPYAASLEALAALGSAGVPVHVESLHLRRVDTDPGATVEAEGLIVGAWLPPAEPPAMRGAG